MNLDKSPVLCMIVTMKSSKRIYDYNGYFRLRGEGLLKEAGDIPLHRACRRAGVSYPTIHRYINGEDVNGVSLPILYNFLTLGLGLSPSQLAEKKLGEIFDLITFD